ncbi:MAG: helix-turn-helix transcriptional regulator [Deltaproteobacteria bacterium]|nr:helix-turn-helix transcriptional regulator [Deltaproteobacteria bacterium]
MDDISKLTGGVPMVRIDGARVKSLRESMGRTQLFLAASVGVTTDTISRWEHKRYPSVKKENALKLAEALEVALEEILEKGQPDEPPAPESEETEEPTAQSEVKLPPVADTGRPPPAPYQKPVGSFAALLLMVAAFSFMAWWFYPVNEEAQVTARRFLPGHAVSGQSFPVVIRVSSSGDASLSLILRENLPKGGVVLSSLPPYSDFDATTGEVKWLRKSEGDQVFAYMVKINQPEGEALFAGKVALPRGAGQVEVSGDAAVRMSNSHWADADADGRISDEEILTVYDKFSDIKGLAINIDLVEEIWLGAGYAWNPEKKKFEVLP